MNRGIKIGASILVIGLLLVQIVPAADAKGGGGRGEPNVFQWVYMIYNDGESLSADAVEIMDEIKKASFGSNLVKIVTLIDISDPWTAYDKNNPADNSNARVYEMKYGSWLYLEDWGEISMGDPNTLSSFVTWSITTYPAYRYALIFFGHGGNWRGVCTDNAPVAGDVLTMPEMTVAFDEVIVQTGKTLDLIGFDSCIMAGFEVAYQLRYYSTVLVASEEVEYASSITCNGGWPHDAIITRLSWSWYVNAEGLGSIIVEEYGKYWEQYPLVKWKPRFPAVDIAPTLSAWRQGVAIHEMANTLGKFATGLSQLLPTYRGEIEACRLQTEEFASIIPNAADRFIDLYDFVIKIEQSVIENRLPINKNLNTGIVDLKWYIDYIKIAEWHDMAGDFKHPNATLLTIYFPETAALAAYDNTNYYPYTDLAFYSAVPQWYGFLNDYWAS